MLPRLVLCSLARHPGVTAFNLATLSVLALLVTLYATVGLDVADGMGGTLRDAGANAVAFPASARADWSLSERVATEAGARSVRLDLVAGTVEGSPVGLVEADPAALETMTPYWDVEGRRPREAGECLAGRKAARRLHLEPGSEVRYLPAGAAGPVALRVSGIATSGDEDDERLFAAERSTAGADSGSAWPRLTPGHPPVPRVAAEGQVDCRGCHEPDSEHYRLVEAAGAVPRRDAGGRSYLLLRVDGGEQGIAHLGARFEEAGVGLEVRPLRQIVVGEESVLAKAQLLTGWTLAAVLVLVVLGVTAAAFARTSERKKELALLVALGGHRRAVIRLLLAENAGLGGAAGVLGFLLGSLAADYVVQRIFHVPAHPEPLALLAALAATALVSLAAGTLAVRKALRYQPAALLRGQE